MFPFVGRNFNPLQPQLAGETVELNPFSRNWSNLNGPKAILATGTVNTTRLQIEF